MLPVTNKKAFHIPHSIATAAAIAGLVVTLGWDVSNIEIESGNGTLDNGALVTSLGAEPSDEPPTPKRVSDRESDPGILSGLLPLVLPSISGF